MLKVLAFQQQQNLSCRIIEQIKAKTEIVGFISGLSSIGAHVVRVGSLSVEQ